MNKKVFFLIFCMIFVGKYFVLGQKNNLTQINNTTSFTPSLSLNAFSIVDLGKNLSYNLTIIQPDYYTKSLGFFCKEEWKLEKSTAIPFRFRLGSVQQCDWLEGKK